MAGYADSIVVEVNSLAGRLGEIFLDPGHATAWDLASQVLSNFPPPCGMLWKLVMEDKLVTKKGIPITRNCAVTCVKHVLEMHEHKAAKTDPRDGMLKEKERRRKREQADPETQ